MPLYHYQARNNKGDLLQGMVHAETEKEAQTHIQALQLECLKLKEFSQNENSSEKLPLFEYEAYDKNNRKIVGTVPAKHAYFALLRLQKEYHLEVSFIVPKGASTEEKLRAKHKSLADYQKEYEASQASAINLKNVPGLKSIPMESLAISTPSTAPLPPQALAKMGGSLNLETEHLVDPVLKIVQQSLAKYGHLLTKDQTLLYQNWIEKLLRLKKQEKSENVYQESNEILQGIQELEIKVHARELEEKKTAMKAELMAKLKKVSKIELKEEKIGYARTKKILWATIHYEVPFLKSLALSILQRLPNDKELALIEESRLLNEKLFLLKKRLETANPAEHPGLQNSMGKIIAEQQENQEKRELLKLQKSKKTAFMLSEKTEDVKHGFWSQPLAQAMEEEQKSPAISFSEEVHQLSAWIFSFYMILYVLHFYHEKKGLFHDFLFVSLPLLEWPSFQVLTLGLFFFYVLLELHRKHFPNSNRNLWWILPLAFLFFSLLIANL